MMEAYFLYVLNIVYFDLIPIPVLVMASDPSIWYFCYSYVKYMDYGSGSVFLGLPDSDP
jgi:hypothetical protein